MELPNNPDHTFPILSAKIKLTWRCNLKCKMCNLAHISDQEYNAEVQLTRAKWDGRTGFLANRFNKIPMLFTLPCRFRWMLQTRPDSSAIRSA